MDWNPQTGLAVYSQIPYQFDWRDWDFNPKVSVVALQEPFKVRTISVADGPATAAASPLQKAWHGVLKSLEPFQLIGGARVADAVKSNIATLEPGYGWVSGDYSAATDRLSAKASKCVLKALLAPLALDPTLKRRVETSLLAAEMDYSTTLAPFKEKVPQELLKSIPLPPRTQQSNGQLMGNILSFPILCLVNLAGYISALHSVWDLGGPLREVKLMVEVALSRGWFTEHELNSLPVLINGDDILFQAPPEIYQEWLRTVRSLGLTPSVGKNYYSDEFFTVNSELYTKDGFNSRPWWGAFETELVRLRNELKFETGEDVLTADLRSVLPKMQEYLRMTVPEATWPHANKVWMDHIKRSNLLEPYKGLNWFIPVQLGGIGLDDTGLDRGETTYAQRKLMARAALDPLAFDRYRVAVETSLLTDANSRLLRSSLNSWWLKGEQVKAWDGRHYVLDECEEVGKVLDVKAYETVASAVQFSSHIDHWLDYHISGIRLDAEKVRASVTRVLHWGLKLSDKHLAEEPEVVERHHCLRRPVRLMMVEGEWVLAESRIQ